MVNLEELLRTTAQVKLTTISYARKKSKKKPIVERKS